MACLHSDHGAVLPRVPSCVPAKTVEAGIERRHEILIPLATLTTILPIKHQGPAFWEIGEQDAIQELILNWLKDLNPVLINGTKIIPEFTRMDVAGQAQKSARTTLRRF